MKAGLRYFILICSYLFLSNSLFAQFPVEQKYVADDIIDGDRFGSNVDINGNYAIISADGKDTGGQNNAGAAYIYKRNASGDKWEKIKTLTPFDPERNSRYGLWVAMTDEVAVITSRDDDNANGVNAGAVYIYGRDEGGVDNWGLIKKHIESVFSLRIGDAVAISGDLIAIGAGPHEDGESESAVYILERNHGGVNNWGEVKKIRPSADFSEGYGGSVAIAGDTLVVGDNFNNGAGANRGAVYVYARNHGGVNNWGEVKKIQPAGLPDNEFFGNPVAISGKHIIAANVSDTDKSVRIFSRNEGGADNWGEVKKLLPPSERSDRQFGHVIAISGDTLAVSEYFIQRVYIYARNAGGVDNWGLIQTIRPTLGITDLAVGKDNFGERIALSGKTLLVGDKENKEVADDAGAAYFYTALIPGTHGQVHDENTSLLTVVGGAPLNRDYHIINVGANDLTVNGISDPGADFSFPNAPSFPVVIPAGDSLSLTLAYSPAAAGSHDASFTVTSNDENDPAIPEDGNGVALNGAQPNTAYGSTGFDDGGRLVQIDLADGSNTLVTGLSGEYYQAMAVRSDGMIFVSVDEVISAVDPLTGLEFPVFDTDNLVAMDFDENDVLYTSNYDVLTKIDLQAGTEEELGAFDEAVVGLSFDPTTGDLYTSPPGTNFGIDFPNIIRKINKTDASTIESYDTGLNGWPDIAFDAAGNLYGSNRNKLVAIDKTNGATTVIGNFTIFPVSGMEIHTPASMTEPEPDEIVQDLADELDDLLNDPGLPPAAGPDVEDANDELANAIADFENNDAQEAYKGLEEAVDHLMDALDDGADVQDAIDAIVDLANNLVMADQTAAQDFAGDPQIDDYLDDAQAFLDDYLDELTNENYDLAIRRLASARKELQRALDLGSALTQGMNAVAEANTAISDIQGAITNGGYSGNANADLQDAIDELNDAITDFNDGEVALGYDDLQDAVEQLQDAEADGADVTALITSIVDLARLTAEVKLAEAQDYAGNAAADSRIADAEADIADAKAELAAGDPDVAVKEYGDAWDDARIAVEHGRGLRKDGTEGAFLPATYSLSQNYPNPFNPSTNIKFGLPEASNVTLKIYNIAGQLVNTLVRENMNAGYHQVIWNGNSSNGQRIASGLYFYHITAGDFQQVKKMILMK